MLLVTFDRLLRDDASYKQSLCQICWFSVFHTGRTLLRQVCDFVSLKNCLLNVLHCMSDVLGHPHSSYTSNQIPPFHTVFITVQYPFYSICIRRIYWRNHIRCLAISNLYHFSCCVKYDTEPLDLLAMIPDSFSTII